jgi:sugar phosphate permease
MGFLTDVLPYRSPVFIMGIIIATLVTLALTLWNSAAIGTISALLFFLGSSISGASIVIAAIECDLGKQEVLKNNQRALATVSGIIDGIAGFGSIVGQLLIGVFEKHLGWRPTFLMLTIATSFSAIPALFFMIKEYREWKSSKKARQYS